MHQLHQLRGGSPVRIVSGWPRDAWLPRRTVPLRLRADKLLFVFLGMALLLALSYYINRSTNSINGLRLAISVMLTLSLILFGIYRLHVGLLSILIFVPFIGWLRRFLDYSVGTMAVDPVLTIAPAALVILFLFTLARRREALAIQLRQWTTTRMCLLLLVFFAFEMLNTSGSDIRTNIAGSIYLVVPLFVVFIAATTTDEVWGRRGVGVVSALGAIIAAYGLSQTLVGFDPSDSLWLQTQAYGALSVDGATRAFGTFVSSEEYNAYLVIAFAGTLAVLANALRLGNRLLLVSGVVCLVLTLAAVFVGSTRGSVVSCVAVLFALVAVRQKSLVRGVILIILLAGLVVLLQSILPDQLNTGNVAVDKLLTHQVSGLADPFGATSTASSHLSIIAGGILQGFTHPIGYGLGSTTQAASKFGVARFGTEFDVSDIFLAGGAITGFVYIAFLARALWISAQLYRVERGSTQLAVFLMLFASLGQTLGSGNYVIGPTILTLVGWSAGQWERHRQSVGADDYITDLVALAGRPMTGS